MVGVFAGYIQCFDHKLPMQRSVCTVSTHSQKREVQGEWSAQKTRTEAMHTYW